MNIIDYYKNEVSFFGVVGRHGLKQRLSLVSLFAFMSSFISLLCVGKTEIFIPILIVVALPLIVGLLNYYMKIKFYKVANISNVSGRSWRDEYRCWMISKVVAYLKENRVNIGEIIEDIERYVDDKRTNPHMYFNTALLTAGVAGIWGAYIGSEIGLMNISGKAILSIGLVSALVLIFQARYIANEIFNRRMLIALELRMLLIEIALDPQLKIKIAKDEIIE